MNQIPNIEDWEKEFDEVLETVDSPENYYLKVKAFLHQQLQKAREEERERAIEIVKDELRTAPLEVQMTKGIVFANIISRIHSELDQDTPKSRGL